MEIEEIIKLIKKNNDILNRKYPLNFEVDVSDDELWIFIHTLFKKLPKKEYLNKLKRIFKAKDVMFIKDGSEPYFWSIRLK